MTINHPDDLTALLKGTFQVTLQDPVGHIFPVHIPVVDLPQSVIDDLAPEDKHKGFDVRLLNSSVVLCLN